MRSFSPFLSQSTRKKIVFTLRPSKYHKKELQRNPALSNKINIKQIGDGVGYVCKRGCTEIHFIELGVKVDGHTILTVFLPRRVLLPNIGRYLKVGFWSFNRTVHQLIKTWHRCFPGEKDTWLYLPILWLPNLPDLNPVDYSIWKRRFTAPELTISTNSKCVWSMSGHASTSW